MPQASLQRWHKLTLTLGGKRALRRCTHLRGICDRLSWLCRRNHYPVTVWWPVVFPLCPVYDWMWPTKPSQSDVTKQFVVEWRHISCGRRSIYKSCWWLVELPTYVVDGRFFWTLFLEGGGEQCAYTWVTCSSRVAINVHVTTIWWRGSPPVWLMCTVIKVQGNNYLYGGGEPSCVAHMHGN